MKYALIAAAIALMAGPAMAELARVEASGTVTEAMDRLESAVENAGATVFARVDHAEGAASVDMELPPAQLLIFGNPKLGTPAMQADPLAGYFLPLKVLAYEQDGQTFFAYQEPQEMFQDLDIEEDADFIGAMGNALQNLTGAATSAD